MLQEQGAKAAAPSIAPERSERVTLAGGKSVVPVDRISPLMAAKFVNPYRLSGKGGKNDATDAAAICEAAQRPNMRFVPTKSLQQQLQRSVHRVQQGFIAQRTATIQRQAQRCLPFPICQQPRRERRHFERA